MNSGFHLGQPPSNLQSARLLTRANVRSASCLRAAGAPALGGKGVRVLLAKSAELRACQFLCSWKAAHLFGRRSRLAETCRGWLLGHPSCPTAQHPALRYPLSCCKDISTPSFAVLCAVVKCPLSWSGTNQSHSSSMNERPAQFQSPRLESKIICSYKIIKI